MPARDNQLIRGCVLLSILLPLYALGRLRQEPDFAKDCVEEFSFLNLKQ